MSFRAFREGSYDFRSTKIICNCSWNIYLQFPKLTCTLRFLCSPSLSLCIAFSISLYHYLYLSFSCYPSVLFSFSLPSMRLCNKSSLVRVWRCRKLCIAFIVSHTHTHTITHIFTHTHSRSQLEKTFAVKLCEFLNFVAHLFRFICWCFQTFIISSNLAAAQVDIINEVSYVPRVPMTAL